MPIGLLTDLYQLTMAAGYFEAGKASERATFELFVRKLPRNRNFILAAGLEQAVDYLLNLRFTPEEVAYLRTLPQFARASDAFFEMLAGFRFTGDLFAVARGTPGFGGAGRCVLGVAAWLPLCGRLVRVCGGPSSVRGRPGGSPGHPRTGRP